MQKFSKMAKSHHFNHTYDDLRAGIGISWRCFRRSDSFFRRFSRFQISTLGWCGRNSLQVLGGSEAVSWWMHPNKPILDAIWNLRHCAALSISTHGHWFLQLVFLVFRGLVGPCWSPLSWSPGYFSCSNRSFTAETALKFYDISVSWWLKAQSLHEKRWQNHMKSIQPPKITRNPMEIS
jgi:hypothetical protein